MIVYDIETLCTESTAVVLSLAAVYFDPNDTLDYDELLDRALFVKFDVSEQIKKYNRTVDKSAVEWWRKQADIPRKASVEPSPNDLSLAEGLSMMDDYYNRNGRGVVWARGGLDQLATESLYKSLGAKPFAMFNMWRDVRTAIDLLYDSKNGYCSVPGFDPSIHVFKHHPVHDCAYDAMMLVHGQA